LVFSRRALKVEVLAAAAATTTTTRHRMKNLRVGEEGGRGESICPLSIRLSLSLSLCAWNLNSTLGEYYDGCYGITVVPNATEWRAFASAEKHQVVESSTAILAWFAEPKHGRWQLLHIWDRCYYFLELFSSKKLVKYLC
jgi:hypothetical protein